MSRNDAGQYCDCVELGGDGGSGSRCDRDLVGECIGDTIVVDVARHAGGGQRRRSGLSGDKGKRCCGDASGSGDLGRSP